jgi:hypothetical protein
MPREEKRPYCGEWVDRSDKVCPPCQRKLTGRALLENPPSAVTATSGTPGASATTSQPTLRIGKPSGVAKTFYSLSFIATLAGAVKGSRQCGRDSKAEPTTGS